MATLATLLVVMGMDTKGLTAGAAKAETTLAGTGASASKFGSLASAAFLGVGVAAAYGVAKAVSAASDLAESVNKVNVVFGASSGEILEWSTTTASSMGISEQAALEAAGTFGNLFDAMGIVDDTGAEMSTTLVGLAADLASFNNAVPDEVLQALQSGLTGQIRPLRQFGIEISEAAIQQEALSQGIHKSTSEMTLAEKVQLRYALILKQTGNAQGDFARTSEGMANQQRILAAEFEDTLAAVGKELLPVALDLVKAFRDIVPALKPVAGILRETIGYATDLTHALMLQESGFKTGAAAANDLYKQFAAGKITILELEDALIANRDATGFAVDTSDEYNDLLREAQQLHTSNAARAEFHARRLEGLAGSTDDAAKAVDRFAGMGEKAFGEFADAMQESVQVGVGEFEKLNDAFDTTPKELEKALRLAIQIAQREQRALRTIFASKDLSDAQKQALANLPANMRDAWLQAGEAGRRQIQQDAVALARLNARSVTGAINAAKRAAGGMTEVGRLLAQGIQQGFAAYAPSIYNTVDQVINNAIARAKAAAEIASPSRKMFKVGLELMTGLQKGITDNEQKVIDAASKVIDRAISEMENDISRVEKALDKVKAKSQEFASTISGGFSSFQDISGGLAIPPTPEPPTPEELAATAAAVPTTASVLDFFQQQLAGAQEFADVLEALRRQGASMALLNMVAAQGPAAIPFARALLAGGPAAVAEASGALGDINRLAQTTGQDAANQFFGKEIGKLESKLDKLHEDLQILKHPQRLEIAFRPGADAALRHLIMQIIGEMNLSRASL